MPNPVQLKLKTIIGAQDGPHLLITGGVHGDEYEPMIAIRRLIRDIEPEQLRGKVTLVPIVNESSFERGERTGDDELDLARTCPGKADGSITERTAYAVSELIKTADYFIDLHTGGQIMWCMPLSGYMAYTDPARADMLEKQRLMARAFNLPIIWGTNDKLNGRTLSVARDHGIPSIYAEYMGGGPTDPKGIDAYYEGCLNVLGALGMIDREQPASNLEHFVEDTREASGHLQVNYPSPQSGCFESSVVLGQPIQTGETIGFVSDALGEVTSEVKAIQTGIVLCLRSFAKVSEGDCLAVILELENAGGAA